MCNRTTQQKLHEVESDIVNFRDCIDSLGRLRIARLSIKAGVSGHHMLKEFRKTLEELKEEKQYLLSQQN